MWEEGTWSTWEHCCPSWVPGDKREVISRSSFGYWACKGFPALWKVMRTSEASMEHTHVLSGLGMRMDSTEVGKGGADKQGERKRRRKANTQCLPCTFYGPHTLQPLTHGILVTAWSRHSQCLHRTDKDQRSKNSEAKSQSQRGVTTNLGHCSAHRRALIIT